MPSPRNYLAKIDNKSFEQCLSFIQEQSSALGVPSYSSEDLGAVLYSWADHLSNESKSSELVFKDAVSLFNTNNPHYAYKKLKSLHTKLSGKPNFLDKLTNSNNLANFIQSHPFYERFQKETLNQGFTYVEEAYKAFAEIDKKVNSVKSQLTAMQTALNSLQGFEDIENIQLPENISDPLSVAQGMDEVRELLKTNPKLFYTPTSTAALASGAAAELALLYKQAQLVLDLAMGRWLCVAYFGLMLNAVVKHSITMETMTNLISAQSSQMQEFNKLLSSVVKRD